MVVRELEALDAIDVVSTSDDSSARFAYALDSGFEPAVQQMADFSGGNH